MTLFRPGAVLAGLLLSLAVPGCTKGPASYRDQIAGWHAEKDRFMRESSESPIPKERRATFPALPYFPTDPSFRTPASLDAAPAGPVIEMPTSSGQPRRMQRVGVLRFTLKGQPYSLGAFVEAGQPDTRRLFVPFGDLTNGRDTYRGGRYLDLDRTVTGLYDLDFNRAYHPFCVFNPSYECPFPPPENRLPIEVTAGERLKG